MLSVLAVAGAGAGARAGPEGCRTQACRPTWMLIALYRLNTGPGTPSVTAESERIFTPLSYILPNIKKSKKQEHKLYGVSFLRCMISLTFSSIFFDVSVSSKFCFFLSYCEPFTKVV